MKLRLFVTAAVVACAASFRAPVVRVEPRGSAVKRVLPVQPLGHRMVADRRRRRRDVMRMGPVEAVVSYVWRAVKGLSTSDYVFGFIFAALCVYKARQMKPGVEVDPDAPKLSGFSYQFVAQTPEDEAKLKTMYCDDCGFTIFVAKNRFKKHFRDGLRCLNCGAKAPTFYNKNDPDDPLNLEGATIDDFDEEAYFSEEETPEQNGKEAAPGEEAPQVVVAASQTEPVRAPPAQVDEVPLRVEAPVQVVAEAPAPVSEIAAAHEASVPVQLVEKVVEEAHAPRVVAGAAEPNIQHDHVPQETNGKEQGKTATSVTYKNKPVPAELQIFRDLDII